MNQFRKILIFVIAVVYLFLSTGITLFKTQCLCSDSTRISLYSDSESCEEIISDHGCCEQENHCDGGAKGEQDHSCGCEKPIVTYLKLTNHLSEGSNLEYPINKSLYLVQYKEDSLLKTIVFSPQSTNYSEYSPPENSPYGRYLLTLINQRKIALAA